MARAWDVRPGDWVLTKQGVPEKVCHVEVFSREVLFCLSPNHPKEGRKSISRQPLDHVEVVTPKPDIKMHWNNETSEWEVEVIFND